MLQTVVYNSVGNTGNSANKASQEDIDGGLTTDCYGKYLENSEQTTKSESDCVLSLTYLKNMNSVVFKGILKEVSLCKEQTFITLERKCQIVRKSGSMV